MGCIKELKHDRENLKRHSIYLIEGEEDFKREIERGADYDFAVICANSGISFVEDLKKAFSENEKLEKELKERIAQTIEWLPGRIIIIGERPENWENVPPSPSDNEDEGIKFLRWIKKRIAWVDGVNWEELKLRKKTEKKDQPEAQSTILKEISDDIDKIKIKLWDIWIDHFRQEFAGGAGIELDTTELGGQTDSSGWLEKARLNYRKLVYMLQGAFPDINPQIVEFAVWATLNKIVLKKQVLSEEQSELLQKIVERLKEIMSCDKLATLLFLPEIIEKSLFLNSEDYSKMEIPLYINLWLVSLESEKIESTTLQEETYMDKIIDEIWPKFEETLQNKIPDVYEKIGESGNSGKFYFDSPSEHITVTFSRHVSRIPMKECTKEGNINFSENYYYENWSGSSTHIPVISSALGSQGYTFYHMIYSLLENSLLTVLVVDERVAKFVGQNGNAKNNLSVSRVDVLKNIDGLPLPEGGQVSLGNFAQGEALTYKDVKDCVEKGVYQVLLIHQGILDKMKLENSERVVQFWKENYFPYVIVTSGRGVPANIPFNTKFIPFSIVESTLMKTYHEKLILSTLLMKSLPARRGK